VVWGSMDRQILGTTISSSSKFNFFPLQNLGKRMALDLGSFSALYKTWLVTIVTVASNLHFPNIRTDLVLPAPVSEFAQK